MRMKSLCNSDRPNRIPNLFSIQVSSVWYFWEKQPKHQQIFSNSLSLLMRSLTDLSLSTNTTQLFSSEGGSAASRCTREYLPKRFQKYGHKLSRFVWLLFDDFIVGAVTKLMPTIQRLKRSLGVTRSLSKSTFCPAFVLAAPCHGPWPTDPCRKAWRTQA